jgi:hypothetical protein
VDVQGGNVRVVGGVAIVLLLQQRIVPLLMVCRAATMIRRDGFTFWRGIALNPRESWLRFERPF